MPFFNMPLLELPSFNLPSFKMPFKHLFFSRPHPGSRTIEQSCAQALGESPATASPIQVESDPHTFISERRNLSFGTHPSHGDHIYSIFFRESRLCGVFCATDSERRLSSSLKPSAAASAHSLWHRFSSARNLGLKLYSCVPFLRHLVYECHNHGMDRCQPSHINLDDLEAVGLIGSGSFGQIIHARVSSTALGAAWFHGFSEFVLKRVDNDEYARNEVTVHSLLSPHPHIVDFIGKKSVGSDMFILIGLLRGPSLGDLFDRHGRFSEAQTEITIIEVARGLQHMHKNRIAHLDIKLDNVMLSQPLPDAGPDNSTPFFSGAQLLDFGLSQICPADKSFTSRWMTGGGGSPGYMSPQQMRGTPFAPEKGDVFSLGVLWFVMLTGKMPFTQSCLENMARNRRGSLSARFRMYDAGVSMHTADMVIRCLMPEEDRRPTIKSLLQDLR